MKTAALLAAVLIVPMFAAAFAHAAQLAAKPVTMPTTNPTPLPAIDRRALVDRHRVTLTEPDARESLQVGNGGFAFGVDVTGPQAFYGNTMSDWGWHAYPKPAGMNLADFKMREHVVEGRRVGFPTSRPGQEALFDYVRTNPHRVALGRWAMRLTDRAGRAATLDDLTDVRQELDLWRGVIVSRFRFDGEPVTVRMSAHPTRDAVALAIESPLLADGRLRLEVAFPYGDDKTAGATWTKPDAHATTLTRPRAGRADLARAMDDLAYAVALAWTGEATLDEAAPHTFALRPAAGTTAMQAVVDFRHGTAAAQPTDAEPPAVADVEAASAAFWAAHWTDGGAIDLSLSADPRWRELERRIVLSQYLMAVQCAGSTPPQESGLFNNGWHGKFHLEMQWWHQAQFALWNRWPLFERSLGWYDAILPSARATARRQGYRGARWPKMVGPDGVDSPSGVGPYLIWQQPHPIFYAELDYRLHPTRATLDKWATRVDETAEFMASLPIRNATTGKLDLGPPIKTVPETNSTDKTVNPAFELVYWRYGLRKAQEWRERRGEPRKPEWDAVLNDLAPLPQAEGVYLMQEGMTQTYTTMNWGHPSVIGLLGMLPGDGVDPAVMRATVKKVFETWDTTPKHFWGWDPPLMAMGAARNGEPKLAVDALMMETERNGFLITGNSTGGPYPYYPSNGGLLYAVAMMAAGWDGAPDAHAPGFPADGTWTVRHENLSPAP